MPRTEDSTYGLFWGWGYLIGLFGDYLKGKDAKKVRFQFCWTPRPLSFKIQKNGKFSTLNMKRRVFSLSKISSLTLKLSTIEITGD